jgi:hypothetical protein
VLERPGYGKTSTWFNDCIEPIYTRADWSLEILTIPYRLVPVPSRLTQAQAGKPTPSAPIWGLRPSRTVAYYKSYNTLWMRLIYVYGYSVGFFPAKFVDSTVRSALNSHFETQLLPPIEVVPSSLRGYLCG